LEKNYGRLVLPIRNVIRIKQLIVSIIFDHSVEVLNASAEALSLPCEHSQLKDVSMSGYVGRRYKVHGCYFKGGMRQYFKVEGKRLTMVVVGVLSEIPDDPETGRFLESFVINTHANQ